MDVQPATVVPNATLPTDVEADRRICVAIGYPLVMTLTTAVPELTTGST